MSLIIPRLRIRDRRPPEWSAQATLEGWLRWELIDRRGYVRKAGEHHNLITNLGLDHVATYGFTSAFSELFRYAAVGTDNTAADVTDTALGAEVSRTENTIVADVTTRPSDGVYETVRSFEFDFDEAIGSLTEWGMSPIGSSGSNIGARELFKDGGGSPEVVTKTADDKLRLIYTRRVTLTPTAWTAGSLAITGHATINGDYRLLGCTDVTGHNGAADLKVASFLAKGTPGAVESSSSLNWSAPALWMHESDLSGVAYDDQVTSSSVSGTAQTVGMVHHTDAPAYTPGSFTRGGAVFKFPTAQGNVEHFALGLLGQGSSSSSGGPRLGFVFDYDPSEEWTKDDLHELRVTLPTITWARS